VTSITGGTVFVCSDLFISLCAAIKELAEAEGWAAARNVIVSRQQIAQRLPRRNAALLDFVCERFDEVRLPSGSALLKLVNHLTDKGVYPLFGERRMDGLLLKRPYAPPQPPLQLATHGMLPKLKLTPALFPRPSVRPTDRPPSPNLFNLHWGWRASLLSLTAPPHLLPPKGGAAGAAVRQLPVPNFAAPHLARCGKLAMIDVFGGVTAGTRSTCGTGQLRCLPHLEKALSNKKTLMPPPSSFRLLRTF
jgi:hypothetical protein